MSIHLTVTLTDDVYRRAERMAQLTGRDVADMVAKMVELSLAPLESPAEVGQSLESLRDDEVLRLSESQMDAAQDERLSQLLYEQQARDLNETEQGELDALMQLYEEGLLRKAQALAEVVRRGLRGPLES